MILRIVDRPTGATLCAQALGLPGSVQDVIRDLFDHGKSFAAIATWIEENL